jgi:integrase
VSIRKRYWTSNGVRHERWVADYRDSAGVRRLKTFGTRKNADAWLVAARGEVAKGMHSPASVSIRVREAAADWLRQLELHNREPAYLKTCRGHISVHINPRIGYEKLARLTAPRINAFRDDLLRDLSRSMARKVLASLKAILNDAMGRGNVAQNVALHVRIASDPRAKEKLKIGIDIPDRDEVRRILRTAPDRWRPLLVTAIFTGLRASELRGLRWTDVDLRKAQIHVCQRADRFNTIGKPKSRAGERIVPVGPVVLRTLREWKLVCPRSGNLDLVFPTRAGRIHHHQTLVRALALIQKTAGLTTPDGRAKYSGLHAFRHFYASWCINRRIDGGLELPPKTVQERLGHSSIVMTLDTYGHLFPRGDDGAELAAAERDLFAP